ncbi:M56 family metallopeptidase [Myxococcus stipitatus]|uniref:M56 family metallopeptidase n=1 Tax=Myxococcus stipitatus TaxID=83455 RepID=UPI003144E182
MSLATVLEAWGQVLLRWLAHGVWQTSVVVMAVAGAWWLLRHRSARARYVVGCLGLALVVLAPLSTLWMTASRSTPVEWVWTMQGSGVEQARPEMSPVDGEEARAGAVAAEPAPVASWTAKLPWMLGGLWLLGACVGLVRLAQGWRRTARKLVRPATRVSSDVSGLVSRVAERLGLRRPVRVLESALAPSPMVLGVVRPLLLLPSGVKGRLSEAQLEAVLAHELAHVRRHDAFVNFVQCLVDVVFFFHPAARWLSQRVRMEREFCCDDAAVSLCGSARVYSGALLGLEELRQEGAVLALGAGGHPLASRVRRLLGHAPSVEMPRGMRQVWRVGGLAGVLVASGMAWAWEAPTQSVPGTSVLASATCSRPVYPKDFTAIASYENQGRTIRSRVSVSRCGRIRLEPADGTPAVALLYDVSTLERVALDGAERTYDLLPERGDLGLPLHLPGGCGERKTHCARQGEERVAGRLAERWHRVHAPHDTVTQWMDKELGYPIRETSDLFGSVTLTDIQVGDLGAARFVIPSDYRILASP